MPFSKEFKFNSEAKYDIHSNKSHQQFSLKKLRIYVNEKDYFDKDIVNIFTDYALEFTTDSELKTWLTKCDMKYWQNQLNFAVFCATAGCGVSLNDHILNTKIPLIAQSFFTFHFYYQTRKIFAEMSVSIPTDQNFNKYNNFINMTEFNKICNEFNIDPNEDFRIHMEPNNGAGFMFDENNNKNSDNYVAFKKTESDYRNNPWTLEEPSGYLGQAGFNAHLTFGNQWGGWPSGVWIRHCKIAQEIQDGWTYFLLNKSEGFTRAGLTRLNDSLRSYIYCILGAQVKMRSSILVFDVQKQFITRLEEAIHRVIEIGEYQEAINNSHCKLDFAIGSGLLLIPSNMIMKFDTLNNYNNSITQADETMDFGINTVNNKLILSPAIPTEFKQPADKSIKIVNNYHDETKYLLPLLTGGIVGLIIYFIK